MNSTLSSINQSSTLPASCSFDDMDRMRIRMLAVDEGLKLTLRGTFMGSEEELTVEQGSDTEELDIRLTGFDFNIQDVLDMEVEFEGDNLISDPNTNYIRINIGCEL